MTMSEQTLYAPPSALGRKIKKRTKHIWVKEWRGRHYTPRSLSALKYQTCLIHSDLCREESVLLTHLLIWVCTPHTFFVLFCFVFPVPSCADWRTLGWSRHNYKSYRNSHLKLCSVFPLKKPSSGLNQEGGLCLEEYLIVLDIVCWMYCVTVIKHQQMCYLNNRLKLIWVFIFSYFVV